MDASDPLRKFIALLMGGFFVAAGLVVMFGDRQTASAGTGQDEQIPDVFSALTAWLGETGTGGLLIAVGVGLAVLLIRAISRQ
ncbi:MAG: hypothetical protein WA989_01740 [Henriciella sp.]|uniref:hypothetical protein n=1 Tax=Henriciella sp. TaxID=1968823 RepID=UPI003C7137D4